MFMRVVVVKCGKKLECYAMNLGLVWTFYKIKKVCISAGGLLRGFAYTIIKFALIVENEFRDPNFHTPL